MCEGGDWKDEQQKGEENFCFHVAGDCGKGTGGEARREEDNAEVQRMRLSHGSMEVGCQDTTVEILRLSSSDSLRMTTVVFVCVSLRGDSTNKSPQREQSWAE